MPMPDYRVYKEEKQHAEKARIVSAGPVHENSRCLSCLDIFRFLSSHGNGLPTLPAAGRAVTRE